jgi:glycosyltransferase involved in cell wall biosynthesis
MKLSIVIPAYNEAGNLPSLIDRCEALATSYPIEFIIVDNGSKDSTHELLSSREQSVKGCKFVYLETNKGYGGGILSGLAHAVGEYVGWTHADMQTDPQDVVEALKLLEETDREIFIKGKRRGRPLGDVFF